MAKTSAKRSAKRKIKDLPENISLGGIKFRDPRTKTVGYWVSQWGYENGEAGIWYRTDMNSTQVHPLFLDNLKEALEFEVMEEK